MRVGSKIFLLDNSVWVDTIEAAFAIFELLLLGWLQQFLQQLLGEHLSFF